MNSCVFKFLKINSHLLYILFSLFFSKLSKKSNKYSVQNRFKQIFKQIFMSKSVSVGYFLRVRIFILNALKFNTDAPKELKIN